MGPAAWILSLRINQMPSGITLDRTVYITELLRRYCMEKCNPSTTPMTTSSTLHSDIHHLLSEADHGLYRSIVGSLMYTATCTRPDISFAVGELGRFTHQPTEAHLSAAKRVLRYLQATKDFRLTYNRVEEGSQPFILVGHTDADYASDIDTRRSVTGYIFTYGGLPVAWKSNKQSTTATSTAEAEYIALSDAGKVAIVLSSILSELSCKDHSPVSIYEDNRVASLMARNGSSMKRSKHIDVRFHLIKELVSSGKNNIIDIPTEEQLADALTKALPRDKHQYFVKRVMRNSVETDLPSHSSSWYV